MCFPTGRTAHTTTFEESAVNHWLEWKIAQNANASAMQDRSAMQGDPIIYSTVLCDMSYVPPLTEWFMDINHFKDWQFQVEKYGILPWSFIQWATGTCNCGWLVCWLLEHYVVENLRSHQDMYYWLVAEWTHGDLIVWPYWVTRLQTSCPNIPRPQIILTLNQPYLVSIPIYNIQVPG